MSPEGIATDITPEIDATDFTETPETPVDPGTETTETSESDDEPEPKDPTTPSASDGPAVANGRLSETARAALAELAKTSPKLAKSIKNSLFEADALRRELPGGLKEVAQMREKLEAFGGPEAIEKSHQELQYFNDLDQQFTAGDPRFIQAMLDTPEGQNGFVRLAPTMMEKYRELAPEAHESYVAKQQYQGMLDADLKFSIVRVKDAIDRMPESPDRDAALKEWGPIANYYNDILGKANRKVEPPKANAAPASPDREAQLNQRETEFVTRQFRSEASSAAKSIIDSELSRLVASRKLTDTQREAVLELGVSRLQKALAKLPNFNQTSQRYFANKDKEGFLRHVSGVYRQQVPAVLKAAADAIQTQKAGIAPKVEPVSGAAPSAPVNGVAKPMEGYTWIAGVPDKTKVDTARTTGDMIRSGRAVLLGGKRVQWRKT